MTSSPQYAQYEFGAIMEKRQAALKSRRKGERTKDALKLATVKLLNKNDYINLRVADICKEAAVSTGTFHRYFTDRAEIAADVLKDYLEISETILFSQDSLIENDHDPIYIATRNWLLAAQANPGLVRCLLQLREEVPAFANVYEEFDHYWYDKIAANIQKRIPEKKPTEAYSLIAAYALGGMVDDITRRLIIRKDAKLVAAVQETAPTMDELAKLLSKFWHRIIYCDDPISD